jgi:two-component system chemotaxis response regulator CheB
LKDFLSGSAAELIRSVKQAARATPQRAPSAAPCALSAPQATLARGAQHLVAIGCSTGGTQALEQILTAQPRDCPGIVVVQHMPEKFTAAFASRLDTLCAIDVREARSGDRVLTGRALIAPGGLHMRMVRHGGQYLVEVLNGPPVNCHKPSVDVMFHSVAVAAGANAMGVILTGMGDDGARGLRAMHDAGAYTLAQDEASCVVYGMPREALRMGGVDKVVALDQVAAEMALFKGP